MGIAISQTYARIDIERTPSRLEIDSQNARLELRQKHAKVKIHTEQTRIEIDQSECFATSGLKKPLDLSKEAAQLAYRGVMEYIGKVASDGDMLAAIENGGEPIADIAERDAFPEREFGLDYMPKASPKFNVRGGVKYEVENNNGKGMRNGVEGRYIPGYLKIKYTPSNIRVYMKQYNSVKIDYIAPNVDLRL